MDRPPLPDGTELPLATSALVKHLRRGRELEGLFTARLIERGGYWRYVWRRLQVFAAEDVGLADPSLIVTVTALWQSYERNRRDSSRPPADVFLTMAVLACCRADKSREVDDLAFAERELEAVGWAPQIPGEAYDLHSPQGRQRIAHRDRFAQWIEDASRVEPRTGYLDWHLWVLRWAAQRGHYAVGFVDALAERWTAQGRLRYGVEGYPEARFNWRDVVREFTEVEPRWPDEEDRRWA